MISARQSKVLHLGYTALVDILLATLGIFIVVFALQSKITEQTLMPAITDGLVICTETNEQPEALLVSMKAGSELGIRSPVDGSLASKIRKTWPEGGRLWVAISRECAFGHGMGFLRDAEQELRRLGDASAPYVLTLAPLAPGAADDLIARWRADH